MIKFSILSSVLTPFFLPFKAASVPLSHGGLIQGPEATNLKSIRNLQEKEICVRIGVECQVPVEPQKSETGFLSCEDYVNLPEVQTSVNTKIALKVEMFNVFSAPIFVTHVINDDKSATGIKVEQGNSLIALEGSFFVDFHKNDNDPLLDINVSSSWKDAGNRNILCEDTLLQYSLPKVKVTLSPSIQPTKTMQPSKSEPTPQPSKSKLSLQPSKDPWRKVGKIIDSDNTNENCGHAVDISSDGKKVLLGCPETRIDGFDKAGSVHLYELTSDDSGDRWENLNLGINGSEFKPYTGISVAFASNPEIFAIGEGKGSVQIFEINGNVRSGFVQKIGSFTFNRRAFQSTIDLSIDLAMGGRRLAMGSASQGGEVVVVDDIGGSNTIKKIYRGGTRDIYGTSVSMSEDGEMLAVSMVKSDRDKDSGLVHIYDVTNTTSNDPIITFNTGASDFTLQKRDSPSSSISKNGKVCAQGNRLAGVQPGDLNGVVKFLDVETNQRRGGSVRGENPGDECGKSVALSYDGETAAIGCNGKVLIAEWDGNDWNVVRKLNTDANSSTSQGRFLESSASGFPVAISKSGDSLIVGSGEELGDGKSGAQVFGSPSSATPPSIAPPTPSPAGPSPPNGGKGKGMKVSKGKGIKVSKGGKGGKGKGISKSPKGNKGKGKKMDGKGKKKNKCKKSKKKPDDYEECVGRNECNVPSEANALKVTFDVVSARGGALNETDLNEMLCNSTDPTSRKRRMRFLSSLEVVSLFVSNVSNTTEENYRFNVNGTAYYIGSDDAEEDEIENVLEEFLINKLTNGIRVDSATLIVSMSFSASEQKRQSTSPTIIWVPIFVAILIISTAFYFVNQRRRYNPSPFSPKKESREHYDNNTYLNISPKSQDKHQRRHQRGHKYKVNNDKSSFPIKFENRDFMLADQDLNSSREILLPSSLSSPVIRRSNRKKSKPREHAYQDLGHFDLQPVILYEDTIDL